MTETENNNIWKISYRSLSESDNKCCPISHDKILDEHAMCKTCNNVFDYFTLKEWLCKNNTCPMCRSVWTNKIKYSNIGNKMN